jgi:hypothetical protein
MELEARKAYLRGIRDAIADLELAAARYEHEDRTLSESTRRCERYQCEACAAAYLVDTLRYKLAQEEKRKGTGPDDSCAWCGRVDGR